MSNLSMEAKIRCHLKECLLCPTISWATLFNTQAVSASRNIQPKVGSGARTISDTSFSGCLRLMRQTWIYREISYLRKDMVRFQSLRSEACTDEWEQYGWGSGTLRVANVEYLSQLWTNNSATVRKRGHAVI